MKVVATYKNDSDEKRTEVIDVPEVKTLYPTERQFHLCEDYVNLSKKDNEEIESWKLTK